MVAGGLGTGQPIEAQPLDQHRDARDGEGAVLGDELVAMIERGGRGHLDRRERAVVQVRLDRVSAAINCALPAAKPMRQPGME